MCRKWVLHSKRILKNTTFSKNKERNAKEQAGISKTKDQHPARRRRPFETKSTLLPSVFLWSITETFSEKSFPKVAIQKSRERSAVFYAEVNVSTSSSNAVHLCAIARNDFATNFSLICLAYGTHSNGKKKQARLRQRKGKSPAKHSGKG